MEEEKREVKKTIRRIKQEITEIQGKRGKAGSKKNGANQKGMEWRKSEK